MQEVLVCRVSLRHLCLLNTQREDGVGDTYTDSLLVGGEFTEDMVSMSWADPHLGEVGEFLRRLIQQRPHLQHKVTVHFSCFM